MKFIACADLHFTEKTPVNRKDDYLDAQLMKFSQILERAENENASLLIAGDVFDNVKTPYKVTKLIMDMIKSYGVDIYAVPGQHDLVYHSDGLDNTPLGILSTMKQVTILSSKVKTEITSGIDEVSLIGAGWNEEPQEKAHIIVMHRMITYKDPLYPGQTDYSTAAQTLHKYKSATYIVSGDNHQPFDMYQKGKGRALINCGSLMRKGKDQLGHAPCVWMIDTEAREHYPIYLKVKLNSDVFDLNKIKREETQDEIKNQAQEDIKKFVKSLDIGEQAKPRFENILTKVIAEVKPNTEVINIINELMEGL